MKLKASVDYGVRAVLYLATKGGTCSSREISEEMCVPRDYLIQLALRLRNAGIIKARPGKNGGYLLAKSPDKITVKQIMDAFDNDLKHVRQPIKKKRNTSSAVVAVTEMHNAVMESLNAYLDCLTVQDVLTAQNEDSSYYDVIANALEQGAARLRSK